MKIIERPFHVRASWTSRHRVTRTALAAACFMGLAFGQRADEIMTKHFKLSKPVNSSLTMVMTISKGGKNLTRTMSTHAAGDNGRGEVERKIIKFVGPADIAGSGFLSTKKLDGYTETLLWLPAMGKVRRLSSGGGDQDQSFFGSDFNNRDISGYTQSDFVFEVKSEKTDAAVIDARPKAPGYYDRYVFTIDPKAFTASRIDFFRAGKLAKYQTATFQVLGKYVVPETITMSSVAGSTTVIKIREQKVDFEMNPNVFTERNLVQ